MQFLNELFELDNQNSFFLVENIGKLKDLGLGRMINAFKQSFSVAGHGSTARLNQTNVGAKIQSRSTGIGPNSEVIDNGHVRNWAHVRRELIKNIVKPGVAAIMFKIDEKPVAIVVLGPTWSINNSRAVVGMAWDFMNVSGADQNVQSVLSGLSIKRKAASDKDSKDGKKIDVPLRMYQGYAQTLDQVTEFVKQGVNSFNNRFDFAFITPEPDKTSEKTEKSDKKPVKEAKEATVTLDKSEWDKNGAYVRFTKLFSSSVVKKITRVGNETHITVDSKNSLSLLKLKKFIAQDENGYITAKSNDIIVTIHD